MTKRKKKSGKSKVQSFEQFVIAVHSGKEVVLNSQRYFELCEYIAKTEREEVATQKQLLRERDYTIERLNLNFRQAQGNADAFKEERNEALRKIRQREKLLVAVLMPWADLLGPRKLKLFIGELMLAVNLHVTIKTGHEVMITLHEEMLELLKQRTRETPEDDNVELNYHEYSSPFSKAFEVFTKWVNDTFKVP